MGRISTCDTSPQHFFFYIYGGKSYGGAIRSHEGVLGALFRTHLDI